MPRNSRIRFIGRASSCCANLALGILASLQIIVILTICFDVELRAPGFVVRQVDKNLRRYGVYARTDSLRFDLTGKLHARNVDLFDESDVSTDAVAHFAELLVEFDLPLLAIGRVAIDGIAISQGQVNCPAIFSGSGITEAILDNGHGALFRVGNRWHIDQFRFRSGNLPVAVTGSWRPKVGPADSAASLSRLFWAETFYPFCRRVLRLQGLAERLIDPMLTLEIAQRKGSHALEAVLTGDGFNSDRAWCLGPFTAGAISPANPESKDPWTIYLASNYLKWGDSWSVDHLEAEIQTASLVPADLINPESIALATGKVEGPQLAIENLVADASIHSGRHLETHATVSLFSRPVSAFASGDIIEKSLHLALETGGDLTPFMSHPWAQGLKIREMVAFPGASDIHFSCVFGKDLQFQDANFDLTASPAVFKGTTFESLIARGSLDRNHLYVRDLQFRKDGYDCRGQYNEDFISRKFRLLLKGAVFPARFNSLFRPWWQNLWRQFEFPIAPVQGDIDLTSDWVRGPDRFLFGELASREFTYKDMLLDQCRLKTLIDDYFIELQDVEARRKEGAAEGVLQWVFTEKWRELAEVRIHLETEFYLEAFSDILDSDIGQFVQEFKLVEPPVLNIRGQLNYGSGRPQNRRVFYIESRAPAPLEFKGTPLDYLNFDLFLDDRSFALTGLDLGFGGGRATGSVTSYRANDGADEVSLDLDLKEANHRDFVALLSSFIPSGPGPGPSAGEAESVTPMGAGKVDFSLKATGRPPDLSAYQAQGNFRFYDARLGSIHLFGSLSRLFSGTWMNFTTLTIKSADSDFTFADNQLQLPNLVFTGANANIRAQGTMSLPDSDLDFRVKVFFLESGRANVLTVFSPLFVPLGHALELRLFGTLDQPQWRFTLDPRNIFTVPDTVLSKPENPFDTLPGSEPAIRF